MLSYKFLSFLSEEDKNIGKLIIDSILRSGQRLVELVNALFPKIEEKTESLRNQLEEAWKIADEVTDYEGKYKEIKKEKDLLLSNLELIKIKVKKLEEENDTITQKLLQIPKEIEKKNSETSLIKNDTEINNNLKSDSQNKKSEKSLNSKANIKDLDKESSKNFFLKNNNNSNYSLTNNSMINNNKTNDNKNDFILNTKPKILSLKAAKEIMNEIYNSKIIFDKKCYESGKPRETLEQHMYTYLNQKYGLKSIIIEWAYNIINGIKIFSSEDSEICLFGKILRNEIEEDARLIYSDIQKSILEYLKYSIKRKNHYISANEISSILKEKKNGSLTEEEWREVINYLYNEEHAKILEERISDIIQKKYFKSKLDTDRKLTREEIIQLSKLKEEYNIPFKDLVKIIHEFQIRQREKQLKNFVQLFKSVDKDNNGIINEEEFVNLLYNMNIFGDQLKRKIVELLTQIDPYNNKQITFSECVNLFGSIPYEQEGNNQNNNQNNQNQISILDKICMG
jgi:hypothetical protein